MTAFKAPSVASRRWKQDPALITLNRKSVELVLLVVDGLRESLILRWPFGPRLFGWRFGPRRTRRGPDLR